LPEREQFLLGIEAIAETPKLRSVRGDKHEKPTTVRKLVVFFARFQVPKIGVVLGRHGFDSPKNRDTNTIAISKKLAGCQQK
jgi:hypothetical protein